MRKRFCLMLLVLLFLTACNQAGQTTLGVSGQPTLVYIYTEN